jgi:hypothetical protein
MKAFPMHGKWTNSTSSISFLIVNYVGLVGFVGCIGAVGYVLPRGFQNRAGWHSRISGSIDIRKKRTNSTSSISFLIVNYVPKLHVGLVGFVSLGTAALVQLDRSNREDSKTVWVGIPGCPVL